MRYDFAIVGGGIVGIATAHALLEENAGSSVLLLEKEPDLALHQTGRNSGVIHSGIYYKPGSFKARFARNGARSMVEFCQQHDIPHEVCGKVIVATEEWELPMLETLYQRGLENQIPCEMVAPERVRELEPHVQCLRAIHVKSTGIVHYRAVASKLADLGVKKGLSRHQNTTFLSARDEGNGVHISTSQGDFEARILVNCAGLQSDRVARQSGVPVDVRIVPFRGEYYELIPGRRSLVKNLIYPVPNPAFPFLGVHFTRGIDGHVHAGPNAVLAWKREGYFKSSVSVRDMVDTLGFGGFWKLAMKYPGEGGREMVRSWLKPVFVNSLRKLIPEVQSSDLVPCDAGVRAQAVTRDGKTVDDFLIIKTDRAVHVLNAPSPAATACLEIGKYIAGEVASLGGRLGSVLQHQ